MRWRNDTGTDQELGGVVPAALVPAKGEIDVPDGLGVPDGWTVLTGKAWSASEDPAHINAWLTAEADWQATQPTTPPPAPKTVRAEDNQKGEGA